jgi:hypothetical protein
LGGAHTTIARGVATHSLHRHAVTFNRPEMAYKASCAHRPAVRVRARPRRAKLAVRSRLRRVVLRWLRRRWSRAADRRPGFVSSSPTGRSCGSRTRRSTRRSTCKRAGTCAPSWPDRWRCAPVGRPADRARPPMGRCIPTGPGWGCTSPPARPRPPTGRYPGTGKATWSPARTAPRRSRPWWNGPPGSSCWSRCPRSASASPSSANSRPRWPICPSGFAGR